MILVSVGTQFPFDRLISAIDDWAVNTQRSDIVAQVGPSKYTPRMLKCFPFLSPEEFRNLQADAELIIAHAGMGSILTALEFSTPIIIMPRDHTLGEHRNAHQLATANRFRDKPGVYVADTEAELFAFLADLSSLTSEAGLTNKAPEALTSKLREFIDKKVPQKSLLQGLFTKN